MKLGNFKSRKEFEDFVDESYICVCGGLFTGLHMLTCKKLQLLKVKWTGKQDSHPAVNIPKVTN